MRMDVFVDKVADRTDVVMEDIPKFTNMLFGYGGF